MAPSAGFGGPRAGGYRGPVQQIASGSLAWTHCTEQGFITVKVLGLDMSTRSARVEVHPEGAASLAAAQAAAEVVREATVGIQAGEPRGSLGDGTQQQHQKGEHDSGFVSSPSVGKKKESRKRQSGAWLHPPTAATEAFGDPLSPRSPHWLTTSSAESDSDAGGESEGQREAPTDALRGSPSLAPKASPAPSNPGAGGPLSLAQIEEAAAAAAAVAAAAATEAFVPRPPLTVPIAHLWPYSAPPMPPHHVPDDSASCGTLSAAALLQQLQHRYLRNEIYTYAAHVLLAVNPYKPLPHLYSAQQILLYKYWREVARAYRRQQTNEETPTTEAPLRRCSSTSSSDAIRSILNRLPGVLPLRNLPADELTKNSSGTAVTDGDGMASNPWTRNNSLEIGSAAGTAAAATTAAAAATEQAFKETTARHNRPPPHPFVVAAEALQRLIGTQTSQTIVVSGQSGAGKTETSKQLMLFLTHASTSPEGPEETGGHGPAGPHQDLGLSANASEHRRRVAALTGGVQTLREAAELRKRIVSCNAIFESFGNAATRRNHNSSRIGRLTLLHFDSGGFLGGGSLRTYLLEAARITAHKRGDRNFHVFYQLLRGKPAAPAPSIVVPAIYPFQPITPCSVVLQG